MEIMETAGDYILFKKLGTFSLGEIYSSKRKGTEEIFAIKKIYRNYIDKQGLSKIIDKEFALSKILEHPNICRYLGIFKKEKYYYLIIEYINGLTLSECLEKYQYKHNASFSEEIVQYLMRQIIDAFRLIHSKNIIYRNINLDNIMVHFNNEVDKNNLNLLKAKIKIIDFSLAQNGNLDKTVLGSPLYMSPELLKSLVNPDNNKIGYDNKIDIWSLGAVCYEMLTGKTVYDAQSLDDLVKKAETGEYRIPNNLSVETNSFLYNMLRYSPDQRLSADPLARHSFLIKKVDQFQKRVDQNGEIIINTKQDIPLLKFDNQATQPNTINNNINRPNNINYYNYNNQTNTYGNRLNYNNNYYNNNINILNNQFFQRPNNLQNYATNLGATSPISNVNMPQQIAYLPSQTNNNVTNLGITNQIQSANMQNQNALRPSQTNNNLGITNQMENPNMQQQIANLSSQVNDDTAKNINFSNATQNSKGQLNTENSQIPMENNGNDSKKEEEKKKMSEGKKEENSGKIKLKSKSAEEKQKEKKEDICRIF